jgi:hypothetical protein
MSLPVEPVVDPDAPGLVLGLAAGAVPLLVSVPLLTSGAVLAGELPVPVWANADVISIVPAAVSASAIIHVFIEVLVFIHAPQVVLNVTDASFSLCLASTATGLRGHAPRVAHVRPRVLLVETTLGATAPARHWT